MRTELRGKSVLLIAPSYFGYDQLIRDGLARAGARVALLNDRPSTTSLTKAAIRINRRLVQPWSDAYFEKVISRAGLGTIDYVLIVIGEALSPKALQKLRASHPSAKVLLYMWDSFDNKPALRAHLDQVDAAYSFDGEDCRKYSMIFRPLFFGTEYEDFVRRPVEFDLAFIGTAHDDRYPAVKRVKASLPHDRSLFHFFYIQSPLLYAWRRLTDAHLRGASVADFSFRSMPKTEVVDILARSRAALDVQHPRQRGLTIRTFEAMGAGLKLVTTNPDVRNYDFFDPQNILVIDRANPEIPALFLEQPAVPVGSALKRKYSLAGWIDEVMDV